MNVESNDWFQRYCNVQQSVSDKLQMKINFKDPCYFTISDSYLSNLQEKKIELKISSVKRIAENEIVFDDDISINVDTIIFATGYRTSLSFLDQKILEQIEYERECSFHPVLLHKTVFPKNIQGLAFVGLVNPPFFPVMEMQAKYACMVFSGKVKAPTKEEIEIGVEEERKIREIRPPLQFTHDDLVHVCDDIAQEIGLKVDLTGMKAVNPGLYEKLWFGPFSVSSYFLNSSGFDDREKATKNLELLWKFAKLIDN